MDDTLAARPGRGEGFPDQRLGTLARSDVDAALRRPITRHLLVTDAGYFPRAHGHRRSRPAGAAETIVLSCVAGTGSVRIDDTVLRVGPGDSVVIPATRPHAYHASDETPWTIWWMHLRGSDVLEMTEPSACIRRVRSPLQLVGLFDEIVAAVERGQAPAQQLTASGIAWRLLALLAADALAPATGSPLEKAMRHLEERLDRSISVTELAATAGVSTSHLTTLFREATGGGPLSFHTALRMSRARLLLDTTGLGIGEIGRAVGYPDPLYFSRRFARVHGLSPSAYRAIAKG